MNHTDCVREFHHKLGLDIDKRMTAGFGGEGQLLAINDHTANMQMHHAAVVVDALAQHWRNGTTHPDQPSTPENYDTRLMRAHLLMEELAELLNAMALRDEVEALDALADIDYVTHGAAVALDLPLEAGFAKVHASNMTKTNPGGDPRVRTKGPGYVPPDLASLMRGYRGAVTPPKFTEGM